MADKFTIKVFFCGDWCPWCNGYLRDFDAHLDAIKSLGGTVVGITSQRDNQSKANNDLRFEVFVDEENAQAQRYGISVTPKEETPLKDVEGVYTHGMVQPGVVVEDAAGKILYSWAIVPSEMNFGGATDRPLVADIVAALGHILEHGSTPGAFGSTDIAYLEKTHPDQHKMVMEYLSSLN